MVKKQLVRLAAVLVILLTLTGCVWFGGFGYHGHSHGHGYSGDSHHPNPYHDRWDGHRHDRWR